MAGSGQGGQAGSDDLSKWGLDAVSTAVSWPEDLDGLGIARACMELLDDPWREIRVVAENRLRVP